MGMTTTKTPAVLNRLDPTTRLETVRETVAAIPTTSRGKLARVTWVPIRGAEPRMIRTEIVGVAASVAGAADTLIVRGANLFTIPLTLLVSIDAGIDE